MTAGPPSEAARALLLLCAPLGNEPVPVLSVSERRRLEAWLRRAGATLPTLMAPGALDRLCTADPPPVPASRLRLLLSREQLLEAVLSRWAASDLVPVGLFDDRYPRRLKRRLGTDSPPVLLLRGDPVLLNRGGTAVIGEAPPRAVDALLHAARTADATLLSVCGDPFAVHLAMGSAPAFLAAPPFRPDPGFETGGAAVLFLPGPPALPHPPPFLTPLLAILLLSDAAVLFPGAAPPPLAELSRALEANWQPIWMHAPENDRHDDRHDDRNVDRDLAPVLRLGARALPPRALDRADLLRHLRDDAPPAPAAPFFPPVPFPPRPRLVAGAPGFAETAAPFGGSAAVAPLPRARPKLRILPGGGARSDPPAAAASGHDAVPGAPPAAHALFELFLLLLPPLLRDGPLGLSPLATALTLDRHQLETWLLRAEGRGLVRHDPATRLYSLTPPTTP